MAKISGVLGPIECKLPEFEGVGRLPLGQILLRQFEGLFQLAFNIERRARTLQEES